MLALAGSGHARLAELEEALSHDAFQPVIGRKALWAEVMELLRINPTLRTTLQVPEGADHGDPDDKMWGSVDKFVGAVQAAEYLPRCGSCHPGALLRLLREMVNLLLNYDEIDDFEVFDALSDAFARLCGAIKRIRSGILHTQALRRIGDALAEISKRVIEHSALWFFVNEVYVRHEGETSAEELLLMVMMRSCCIGALEGADTNERRLVRSEHFNYDAGPGGDEAWQGPALILLSENWRHANLHRAVVRAVETHTERGMDGAVDLEADLRDALDEAIASGLRQIRRERWARVARLVANVGAAARLLLEIYHLRPGGEAAVAAGRDFAEQVKKCRRVR